MTDYADWRQWAAKMQARSSEVRAAIREGTREATNILHVASKAVMDKRIYSIPEDRAGQSYRRTTETDATTGLRGFAVSKRTGKRLMTKGGKKWRRTGNLRRSERKRMLSDIEGLVENDATYALPRHDLGYLPGSTMAIKGSKRKSARRAPFRKQAIFETRDARLEAYRKHVIAVLMK